MGEQLIILDDMVLDVGKYKWEHPGGAFLLDFHVGRDVSKFFYGGYVLENESGMKPHTHTNVARAIVNSLIVGKLTESANTFTAVITSSEEVNKATKVFTLRLEGADISYQTPPSTSLETIGKHYLIRSLNNPNVRRHYTISSCMKKSTYQEYIRAIEEFKAQG